MTVWELYGPAPHWNFFLKKNHLFKVSGNSPKSLQSMKEHLFRKIYKKSEKWKSVVFKLKPAPSLPTPSCMRWKLASKLMQPRTQSSPSLSSQLEGYLPSRDRGKHFSSCPNYMFLRLNFGWMQLRGGVSLLSPSFHSWDKGFPLDRAPLRIIGAPVALVLAGWTQVPLWERQAKECWGCCSPVPSSWALMEVLPQKKHAVISSLSFRSRAQKVCWEEQADLITVSSESPPKETNLICSSCKFLPEGTGSGERQLGGDWQIHWR